MLDQLNKLFYYDGTFLRNKSNRNPRAMKDAVVGSKHRSGYFQVQINGRLQMVHRIIWMMHTGETIPDNMEIDHINHIRDDNRIENLRLVTKQENRRNQKLTSRNKSGRIGVSKYNPRNKWQAQIKVDGKNKHLGFYDTFNEAVIARETAEKEHKFHPNHGGE